MMLQCFPFLNTVIQELEALRRIILEAGTTEKIHRMHWPTAGGGRLQQPVLAY